MDFDHKACYETLQLMLATVTALLPQFEMRLVSWPGHPLGSRSRLIYDSND